MRRRPAVRQPALQELHHFSVLISVARHDDDRQIDDLQQGFAGLAVLDQDAVKVGCVDQQQGRCQGLVGDQQELRWITALLERSSHALRSGLDAQQRELG